MGWKFPYIPLKGCPLFWKLWKMLFHSPLEVSGTENWNCWSNGQHLAVFFTLETKVIDNLIFRQELSNRHGFELTLMLDLVFQCHNMPFDLGVLGQRRHNDVRHQPHWRLV